MLSGVTPKASAAPLEPHRTGHFAVPRESVHRSAEQMISRVLLSSGR